MTTVTIEIENLRDALASIEENGERREGEKAHIEQRLAQLLKLREELWPGRFDEAPEPTTPKIEDDEEEEEGWFLNHYRCDECIDPESDPENGELLEWSDEWSCQCDDECPECGRAFSPYKSEDA